MRTSVSAIAILFLCAMPTNAFINPPVEVTIEVVDEEGRPIEGAMVGIEFERDMQSDRFTRYRETTNAQGMWTKRERTSGDVGGGVSKDGYYETSFGLKLEPNSERLTPFSRWKPVHERIILRRKENPVPMYAREIELKFPVSGEERGFDFLKADWTPPHGKGEVTDVIMRLSWIISEDRTYRVNELLWRFPNEGDGIQKISMDEIHIESGFRLPRYAPESGYAPEHLMRISSEDQRTESGYPPSWTTPLFFRIRTTLGEDGRVAETFYGKIRGFGSTTLGVRWTRGEGRNPGYARFTYYVNPDGTRNMEFDPARNLFPDFNPRDMKFPKAP